MPKVTGVDIYTGSGTQEDDEEEDDDDEEDTAVQEFEKKRWNLNAPFREDTSRSRLRPETFDLINSQMLANGINASRWPGYVQELKQLLKPGGWLQMVELHLLFQSDSGRTDEMPSLQRWNAWYVRSMETMNKNPRVGPYLRSYIDHERFEEVRAVNFRMPVGDWSPGEVTCSVFFVLRLTSHQIMRR